MSKAPLTDVPILYSLRTRLVAIGLGIWCAAAALFGLGAIMTQRAALQRLTLSNLTNVARSRSTQVQAVVHLVVQQIEALAATDRMQVILAGEHGASNAAWLRNSIVYPALPIERLTAVGRNGMTVLTEGEGEHDPPPAGVHLTDVSSTVIYASPAARGRTPAFDIIVPVQDGSAGAVSGWLRARVRIDRLYDILLDPNGLNNSGETYLVDLSGRMLSPSRFTDHLTREEPAYTSGLHMALGGSDNVTDVYTSYRGIPVMGAAVRIPDLDWVVVAEIEVKEALASVYRLADTMLGLGTLAGILAGIVAMYLSARTLRRLNVLQAAARDIAAGRWDVQVAVAGKDELYFLASAFNRMAATISHFIAALQTSEAKLSGILEVAPDAIITVDEAQKIVLFNRAAEQIFGYTAAEAVGKPLNILLPSAHAAAHESHVQRFAASPAVARRMGERGEMRGRRKNGEEFPAECSIARLQTNGQTLVIASLRDITERKRAESQLVQLANYDSLTGVFNRHRLEQELQHRLVQARSSGVGGALLLLDLDQFKDVNDSRGHGAGDALLKALATLLREQTRETDVLARQGGDEFAILLYPVNPSEAQSAAERIRQAIHRSPFLVGGQPVHVTASIGIAVFPDHGTAPEELFVCTDLALYRAKESGRDAVFVFEPAGDSRQQTESKLTWVRCIHEALEKDRFVLYAQPILDLRRRRVSHYELLLRMLGPDGEVILPGEFLDVAERSGLIRSIDRWVVCRVIRLLADQHLTQPAAHLSLNLSAKAFEDQGLVPLIRQELTSAGVVPQSLVLEITETAAIADLVRARDFIIQLKQLGFQLALDDFGVGFSSFRHLRELPVDYLKIDGSFIRDLARNPMDQHLVKSMVEVARGMGKSTVAEFVGDATTVTLLRQLGVDYAQGYHIGRPQPVTELFWSVGTGSESPTE